jgi:hypothetical protein
MKVSQLIYTPMLLLYINLLQEMDIFNLQICKGVTLLLNVVCLDCFQLLFHRIFNTHPISVVINN